MSEPEFSCYAAEQQPTDSLHQGVLQFICAVREKVDSTLGHTMTLNERQRILQLLKETDEYMNSPVYRPNVQSCTELLVQIARILQPIERRFAERTQAVEKFHEKIRSMHEWLDACHRRVDTDSPIISQSKIEQLRHLMDDYHTRLVDQYQCVSDAPEEFAMRTAQLIAEQHAMEVSWSAIVDGKATSVEFLSDNLQGPSSPTEKPKLTKSIQATKQSMLTYISEITRQIQGPLTAFVNYEERQQYMDFLEEVRLWLYKSSSGRSTAECEQYLRMLEQMGLRIEQHLDERIHSVKRFKRIIEHYRLSLAQIHLCNQNNWVLDNIQLKMLEDRLENAENWLRLQQYRQYQLQLHWGEADSSPLITTGDIINEIDRLQSFWNSIVQPNVMKSVKHNILDQYSPSMEKATFDHPNDSPL